jgi:hypothetical protein
MYNRIHLLLPWQIDNSLQECVSLGIYLDLPMQEIFTTSLAILGQFHHTHSLSLLKSDIQTKPAARIITRRC